MKKFISMLVAVLFATSQSIYADNHSHNHGNQANTIYGHIVEQGSSEPVPYATILVLETGQGLSADENGQFEFADLRPGDYTLRAQSVGYKTTETRVAIVEVEVGD